MSLLICTNCGEHHFQHESICPHCNVPRKKGLQINTRRTSMAVLLGLVLAGCGDKEEDTSSEPTSEPTAEPVDDALYGVPEDG